MKGIDRHLHVRSANCRVLSGAAGRTLRSPQLPALNLAAAPDPAEKAASFGRWWFDPVTSNMVLTATAAGFLNVDEGLHEHAESCFTHVVADDMPPLAALIRANHPQAPATAAAVGCDRRADRADRAAHRAAGIHPPAGAGR